MHDHSLDGFTHAHVFLGRHHAANERRTLFVVCLTAAMMVAEIVGGAIFGSMALIADGFHMSTHAAALGVAALAYVYARRHADDPRFAFGTGKFGDLAAFASGLALAMVALLIAYELIGRLIHPRSIVYDEALAIAGLGLCVNLASAWLLRDDHAHSHHHDHGGDHDHAHSDTDHNLRAAYVHVLADAATSLLAIGGLFLARNFGLVWMDPLVGLAGCCVILSWAYGLVRDSAACSSISRRMIGCARPSRRGSRRTATSCRICICGGLVPAIEPRSSRSSAIILGRRRSTRRSSPICPA